MHWLFLLLVVYGAWCAGLYYYQDRLMFPLDWLAPAMASVPDGAEPIVIEPEENGLPVRVEACFIRDASASAARPAPLLVFFHGNAETVDNCLQLAAQWRRRGFAVLLVEYRGYGRSYGTPGEKHLVADALEFIRTAASRPGVDERRIVLHGRSLGAGVASQVAARLADGTGGLPAVAAVIVESAFTSVPRLAARFLAPPFLIRNTFRNDRALKKAAAPVLILHGADDEIIPVSHGRRLHRLLPGSTYAELAGSHNDFPIDEAAYWAAIDGFIGRVLKP